jgi:hypothetical protein
MTMFPIVLWLVVASNVLVAPPSLSPDPTPTEPTTVERTTVEPTAVDPVAVPPTPVNPAVQIPTVAPTPVEPTPEVAPSPRVLDRELPPAATTSHSGRTTNTQTRSLWGPSTRGGFIVVSVGGTRPIRSPEYGSALVGSFHLEQALGTHFRDGGGAALAIVTQQTLDADAYAYAFAGRFQYDAEIGKGLGLYLAPLITIGYRRVRMGGVERECGIINDPSIEPISCAPGRLSHQVTLQFGLEAKIVAADRLVLSFRPVTVDVGVPHADKPYDGLFRSTVRWQLVGGLGLTF